MPNIKSAIKRVKVSEKKNLRNRIIKTGVKTSIKKFQAAVATDPNAAGAQFSATTSAIDKAVSKGIIHKNAAAHKKSQFTKKLNAMQ